jgi:DTW domain-containing protein
MLPRCPGCALPLAFCICAEVPRLATRTRVVIVQHAAERGKASNTARLAAAALGCALHPYAVAGAPFDPAALDLGGAWLLFPDGPPAPPGPPPPTLVVVDGTWQQARRMVQRLPALRALPRLRLEGVAGERLRRPPRADGQSTLEALARALSLLGEPAAGADLLALHARFVAATRAANGTGA